MASHFKPAGNKSWTVEIKSARFQREAQRRIRETFPPSRLAFFQSLRVQPMFSAFRKILQVLKDEERAWHLFLLALHVLYEGWHDLPPLSLSERKTLSRNAQSLRAVAGRLRRREIGSKDDPESAALEKMANRLEWIVCPSADGLYNPKPSRGRRTDPREAIPVFELANLFRQRLAGNPFYSLISDLLNSLPGRSSKYNVQTIKNKLAHLEGARFQPRVQFIYRAEGVVTLKFRDADAMPGTND